MDCAFSPSASLLPFIILRLVQNVPHHILISYATAGQFHDHSIFHFENSVIRESAKATWDDDRGISAKQKITEILRIPQGHVCRQKTSFRRVFGP